MGTVLSSMSMQFEAEQGMTVPIIISVLNKSNSSWPRHPTLVNVNTNESITIEEILKPQEQTKVQYDFTVAADESKSVIVNQLQFRDSLVSQDSEKFGDSIILVCEVQKKSIQSASGGKSRKVQPEQRATDEKQQALNGVFDDASKGIKMIDQLMQLAEDSSEFSLDEASQDEDQAKEQRS